MDSINSIVQPIEKELETFQKSFREALQGHNSEFQAMLDCIAVSGGKRIRPIILLLSARLCGEINRDTIEYAIILELLHTVTLIHDDVVDSTLERRGHPSVNAQFDNRIAVLLGDYILSLVMIRGTKTRNYAVLDVMGRLAQSLSEGELMQMIFARDVILEEKRYFDVIRKKTAILLASCTEFGAISAKASQQQVEILRKAGDNIGLCFQIRDDIFDYFEQGEIGKPVGNDIREGKITLPLMHALQTAPENIAKPMLDILKKRDFSTDNITRLIDFAKEQQGVEYACDCMTHLKNETVALLQIFPDSPDKTALIDLIDYIIKRKK